MSASSGAEIEAIAQKKAASFARDGHDRTLGHKFVGCRTFGVRAFKRSEEDRVASRTSLLDAIRQRRIARRP
jgi:hypothetical protein